jgi:hypothetical protein
VALNYALTNVGRSAGTDEVISALGVASAA